MTRRTIQSRPGFTLIEFVVAMAIVSVILLGLGAAVSTAMRTTELGARGASARTPETARILEQITTDLRLALQFTTPLTVEQVEFTVPDRDLDGLPERITWAWSGEPDFLLTRQEWLSASGTDLVPVVVADDVRDFDLTYVTKTWGPPPPPPALPSAENVLIAHDDVPDGSGTRALLVTAGGGASLPELTREGLLTWWGFTVTRIGAGEPADAFDDAVAAADVVYVPATVDDAVLADTLAMVPIGVVNEHAGLYDEFGFAGMPGPVPAASALTILSSAHYVTSPLGTAPISLFTSDQPTVALPVDATDRAPQGIDLGAWASTPALAVAERGAKLYGAGAPGAFGHDTVFPSQSAFDDFDKMHVATRVTLDVGATVQSISAHLAFNRDKLIRYGIYADDAGEPGALIIQTGSQEFAQDTTGWCTVDLEREVDLAPGTYWLALGMQKDIALQFEHSGGQTRFGDSGEDPKNGLMTAWTGTYGPDPNERLVSIVANYTEAFLAPGRRVTLPWGGAGVDVTALTDAGKNVMQRSVEWAADTSPDDTSVDAPVGGDLWLAQHFLPSLPVNAVSWSITRVLVAIRANPDETAGKVRFELRHSGPGQVPGEQLIQETAEIPNVNWNPYAFTWYEIPFVPVSDLNPNHGVCLVLRGRKPTDVYVKLDSGPGGTDGTHCMTSIDHGSTWSAPNATDDLRYYVFGTYATEGDPVW